MEKRMLILALALIAAVGGGSYASGGTERLRKVLGSGASESVTGLVTLPATLGQPVDGLLTNTSGQVSLRQGFWPSGTLQTGGHSIRLPLVIR